MKFGMQETPVKNKGTIYQSICRKESLIKTNGNNIRKAVKREKEEALNCSSEDLIACLSNILKKYYKFAMVYNMHSFIYTRFINYYDTYT